MHLKQSLIVAVVLSVLSITAWELYWRSQGYFPDLDDDKYLWAHTRAKVDKATNQDVVLIGSSRVLFDIQVDKWKQLTGIQPIQLANPGSSPLPVFHDIVENSDFKGTIIIGVTEGLFFSTTFPQAGPWRRPASRVEFYEEETYAQKLNFYLGLPLQNNLAFISNDDEDWYDDINLKSLLNTIEFPKRTAKPKFPPFYRFQDMDFNRNTRMKDRMLTDTIFNNSVKTVWKAMISGDMPPPDKKGTTEFFLKDVEKFKARGGKIILLRCPSDGFFKELETQFLPRTEYWDELVSKANVPAYHYLDYESLSSFKTVEWSHLSGQDADKFTENFINLLYKDNHITNQKTN